MITKQEVADYINLNIEGTINSSERNKLLAVVTPDIANILIKLLGDVAFLTEIRDSQ
jgi:hypothetical protein